MSFWRDARFLQAGTRQRATAEDAMSGDAQLLWVSRYCEEARVPGIENSDIVIYVICLINLTKNICMSQFCIFDDCNGFLQ